MFEQYREANALRFKMEQYKSKLGSDFFEKFRDALLDSLVDSDMSSADVGDAIRQLIYDDAFILNLTGRNQVQANTLVNYADFDQADPNHRSLINNVISGVREALLAEISGYFIPDISPDENWSEGIGALDFDNLNFRSTTEIVSAEQIFANFKALETALIEFARSKKIKTYIDNIAKGGHKKFSYGQTFANGGLTITIRSGHSFLIGTPWGEVNSISLYREFNDKEISDFHKVFGLEMVARSSLFDFGTGENYAVTKIPGMEETLPVTRPLEVHERRDALEVMREWGELSGKLNEKDELQVANLLDDLRVHVSNGEVEQAELALSGIEEIAGVQCGKFLLPLLTSCSSYDIREKLVASSVEHFKTAEGRQAIEENIENLINYLTYFTGDDEVDISQNCYSVMEAFSSLEDRYTEKVLPIIENLAYRKYSPLWECEILGKHMHTNSSAKRTLNMIVEDYCFSEEAKGLAKYILENR